MRPRARKGFGLLAGARIARAQWLAERHAAAREVLRFYGLVVEFQRSGPEVATPVKRRLDVEIAEQIDLERLLSRRQELIALVVESGPATLRTQAQQMDSAALREALEDYLNRRDTSSPRSFFARALLQPAMAKLRLAGSRDRRADPSTAGGQRPAFCPSCGHVPQVGALRPHGDGLELSFICALCLEEWPFPRGHCPACDERNERKLAYYSSDPELRHIQVLACESCRRYVHTVNLSREPKAIPDVDELVALPLDVWAQENGFQKLQLNLAGI